MQHLRLYIFAPMIALTFLLTVAINQQSPTINHQITTERYHFSTTIKQHVTFGYDRTLAVLYWFGVISDYGGKNAQQTNYKALAEQLDLITLLNPYAEHAYFMAAVLLPWQSNDTTLSRPLLKRAMQAMPDQWRWPFYYGFNRYWFDHDMAKAAKYMMRSAALPNASPGVARIASRLQAEASDLNAAIDFLQQMLKNKQDETLKQSLQQRILAIKTEQILRNIETELAKTPNWNGDKSQLKILDIHLPEKLPDGGKVLFDTQHHPISSKQTHRFKVFVPPHRAKELKNHE